MSARLDRWCAWNLLGIAFTACGEPAQQARAPEEYEVRGIVEGADVSRCDTDVDAAQVMTKSASLGVPGENIERVYDITIAREGAPRVLRCRRVDTDLDGIVDLIRTYDENGEPHGEQADANLDGRVDTWLRFSRGYVIEQRRDHNADGRPDELRIYSGGRLSRVRKDRDYDGRVDTWEVYDGTRLHRRGVDVDGDGRVDRWERDRQEDDAPKAKASREQAESGAAAASPAPVGDASKGTGADDGPSEEASGRSSESPTAPDDRLQPPPSDVPSARTSAEGDGAATKPSGSTAKE